MNISISQLSQQLLDLGVQPGGVLLVHTAFSKVGQVEDGPKGLIAALREALGAEGTLVMPSMTDDDEHPFDLSATPCLGMGIVADTFWRLPDMLRSDSPHSFAAVGPKAQQITAPHPVEVPHGLDSPVGRVYQLGGQVLLLGVGHDANTTVHLAEYLGEVCYRRDKYVMTFRDGQLTRVDYREIDHCCENFNLVDGWLDEQGLQVKGKVGSADARLIRSQDIVRTVLERLKTDATIFLHPEGVDEECDDAWASLKAGN